MSEAANAEQQLAKQLQTSKITSLDDEPARQVLNTIKKLSKKKKWAEAAQHYAALAHVLPKDFNPALQAARHYQKAQDTDAAARWFLETAERYANNYETSKAIATLRIYTKLRPDDSENPKRIYDICLQNGAQNKNPPSIILSDADRAGSRLLASDLFKAFDSAHFDDLIKALTYHKYADGDVINRMGDKATSLYIVISGAVSGYLTLNNKRTYLGDIGENNIFGETAYFTGGRRTAEVIAKGETEVFELPYSMLDKFQHTLPSFNKHIEELYKTRMLVKQLALTSLFEKVRAQCREWVAPRMRPVTLKAGETLFKQNDTSLDLYLVRAGKLAVTIDVAGQERLVKTVETGGIVGETAIVAKKRRTASVRCISDCMLMKLDGKDYEMFYQSSEPVQKALQKIKKKHVKETLDIMKNVKHVEGDDTCEILIKDIWANH